MTEFSKNEAAVLNYVQQSIPFERQPFLTIGSELGLPEKKVREIIIRLKKRDVIRNISGIFNGGSLGYTLNLVAMEIPKNKIEKAARMINSHPGVSHNYVRKHRYNIWFTLAEENEELFDKTIALLAGKTEARDFLVLRNDRLLKIGVILQIGEDSEINGNDIAALPRNQAETRQFSKEEKEAVRLLQNDLPIVDRPFLALVKESSSFLSENRFINMGKQLKTENIMRRYSGVLRHMNAGYTFNAMTTWKINSQENIDEKSKPFMEKAAVSHLYLRTIYPGKWEYPLFAMIHARSKPELIDIIEDLSKKSGLEDYLVLQTERELKKKRVVYFSHKFFEWRTANND